MSHYIQGMSAVTSPWFSHLLTKIYKHRDFQNMHELSRHFVTASNLVSHTKDGQTVNFLRRQNGGHDKEVTGRQENCVMRRFITFEGYVKVKFRYLRVIKPCAASRVITGVSDQLAVSILEV